MYEECDHLSNNCAFVGHCTKYKIKKKNKIKVHKSTFSVRKEVWLTTESRNCCIHIKR